LADRVGIQQHAPEDIEIDIPTHLDLHELSLIWTSWHQPDSILRPAYRMRFTHFHRASAS
jgi:hypothetical protein